MAQFGLGDYVFGKNEIYDIEGKIIGMHESLGVKPGLLYSIQDADTGLTFDFYGEEIQSLVIPRIFNHTLEELAKEYFYLNGDKRVAKLNIMDNPTRCISRYENNVILTFKSYNRRYRYSVPFVDIREAFHTRIARSYAHRKQYYEEKEKYLKEQGII